MKRNFKWMLAAILTISGVINMYAEDNFALERISNPSLGVGEIDGFMPGGDLDNDYTTSMATCGDYIYIATSRNLGSGWVNVFTPKCDFWGIFSDAIWGIYPRDDQFDGANIVMYNRKDGTFKYATPKGDNTTTFRSENTVSYRSAVTFNNAVYFGAFSADPNVKPYILKVDKNGEATKVFETRDCNALHANCIYDNHLFFGGADEREEVTGGAAKLAVLRMSSSGEWNRVADYKDFGAVAYDKIFDVWSDSPIWSLASHNGYIYATLPSSNGFVIFRGHSAATGETANKYGWYWEEVAGLTNGKNNPGLSNVVGGEPGTLTSLSGSLYEFNGKLYAYNFDHSIFGELSVFLGGLKSMTNNPAQPATAIDLLSFAYKTVNNKQSIWCLNEVTGKFEEQGLFSQQLLGTMNGRLSSFDGQLYLATLDAGHLYTLMSEIAATGYIGLTPSEIIAKLTSLAQTIGLLKKAKQQDTVLIGKLEQLMAFLTQFLTCNIFKTTDINTILTSVDLVNLNNLIKSLISGNTVTVTVDYQNWLDFLIKLIQGKLSGTTIEIPNINLPDLLTVQDYQALLDELSKLIIERLNGGSGTTPDYSALTSLLNSLLASLGSDADSALKDLVNSLLAKINAGTGEINYSELLDLLNLLIGGGTTTPDYSVLLDFIQSLLNNSGSGSTIGDLLNDLFIGGIWATLWNNIQALLTGINSGFLSDYVYLYNRMRTNRMGCNIVRTSDGVIFETVTSDGFGDKYNYGCPCFAATEKSLYIATSNSFFGGQLWKLTNKTTPGAWADTEDDADGIQTITTAATQPGYYTLDGRRVNGKPAQKGIYIYNGKKVAVE